MLPFQVDGDRLAFPGGGDGELALALLGNNLRGGGAAVPQAEDPDFRLDLIVIIRPVIMGAEDEDGVLPYKEGQVEVVIIAFEPLAALYRLAGEPVGPEAFRQVVLPCPAVVHDRRDQQRVAQHILGIDKGRGPVVRELEEHRAHHRDTGLMGLDRLAVEVRHQPHLELGKCLGDGNRLVAVHPRHFVGVGAVVAAVGGEEAELGPALEDVVGGGAFKAADIVAPVAEAAQRQRQAAPEGLGQRRVGREVVAAPVDRELLAAHRGAAGKQAGVPFPVHFSQQVVDRLVVEVGVVVVHLVGVGTVEIADAVLGGLRAVIGVLDRNSLAEVGLEAVDAHLAELPQVALVPFDCVRVGEVDQRHAGLPHIPLPDAAVAGLDKVALLNALFKQAGFLADIGVDPAADLDAAVVDLAEHPFGVLEGVFVPDKVGPLELFHPEAVEVEDGQRDLPLQHPVDEGEDGLLVVVGGERGGEPEAEGPGGHHRRAAGQAGVAGEDFLIIVAADDHVFHRFAGDRELDPVDNLRADLIGDGVGRVDKQPVSFG